MPRTVDRQLDLRGRVAVAPLALVQGVSRCLAAGRVLVVRCDRTATCRDVRGWAARAGFEVVAREGGAGDYRLYLRRPPAAIDSRTRGA